MDFRLEVFVLPVSDVDRAKAFYERLGFHCDVDHPASPEFRVVQFTPPGSGCCTPRCTWRSPSSPASWRRW